MSPARTKLVIGAAALAALLWWGRKRAQAATNTAPPPGTPTGSGPGSQITVSQYVKRNGTCYRVDFFADGTHTSTVTEGGLCDSDVYFGAP